jgi:hypothetical protein
MNQEGQREGWPANRLYPPGIADESTCYRKEFADSRE